MTTHIPATTPLSLIVRPSGILVLLLLPLINAQGRPKELSFTTPDSVLSDYSMHAPYVAPHWKDTNKDGDAADVGERRFPVTYLKDTFVTVSSVTFEFPDPGLLPDPLTVISAKVYGLGPDNDYFEKAVDTLGLEFTVGPMTSTDKLPATVRFYNPYTIAWYLAVVVQLYEGQATSVYTLGKTDNRMYVMFASTVGVYESLGQLSCAAADGKSTTDEIRHAIWTGVFSTGDAAPKNPKRKPLDGFNNTDNAPLKYCGTASDTAFTLPLLLEHASGRCGSWAEFLFQAWAKHGVSSAIHVITALNHDGLAVNNYDLRGDATPDAEGYYLFAMLESTTGIPGQNMVTPARKMFLDHVLVKATGASAYYDPSYGTKKPSADDWISSAVWGIGLSLIPGPGVRVKPNVGLTAASFQGF